MFPKSEKWVPIYVLIFISVMILGSFISAWIDPDRYHEMIKAVTESIGDLKVVGSILMGAALWYSNQRHGYKKEIIKLNGYKPDGENK